MELEEFQKQTNERLDKLEKKNFEGTFYENYKSLSAREHAEHHDEDGQHHFLGIRSLESAKQKIESFKNEFDEGSVNSLHGAEIKEYKNQLNLVNELARKWNLPSIESLLK